MSKRLLFLFPLARYMRAHWADRIRAAVAEGYEVHIGVPFDDDLNGLNLSGAALHDLPLRRGLPSLWGEVRCILAIWSLLKVLKPDLIHAVTIRPVAYAGVAARLLRAPAILHSLTGLGFLFASEGRIARLLRPVVQRVLRFAFAHPNAYVLFENHDDQALLVAQGLVAEEQTSVFIGSGLDLEAFAFAPIPHDAVPLVTLPSRLIAPKGIPQFVEAARRLNAEGVNARFAVVGEGDPGNPDSISRATLDQWASEGAIEYWGWQDDIAAVLRASTIVCLPSHYREGAPRILIEAAAIGRPCITTDWPGCRDVVMDGETGLLVPPRDVSALVDALRHLLADRARCETMGRAARAHAEAAFSNERAFAHLFALYNELLGHTPRNS